MSVQPTRKLPDASFFKHAMLFSFDFKTRQNRLLSRYSKELTPLYLYIITRTSMKVSIINLSLLYSVPSSLSNE